MVEVPENQGAQSKLELSPSASVVRNLTWTASLLGSIVALVGAASVSAWIMNPLARQEVRTTKTIEANTALCLVLCGATVVLLTFSRGTLRKWLVWACAGIVLLIGVSTLIEKLFSWHFAINHFPVWIIQATHALSSIGFSLAAAAMLLFSIQRRRTLKIAQILSLAVCLIGLLGTIDFLYGVHPLNDNRVTVIGPYAAIMFLMLGLALIFLRPAEGLMATVTANDEGGRTIRHLVPWYLGAFVLLGYLHLLGEERGLYDHAAGAALLILFLIFFFSFLIYLKGLAISRSEMVKRRNREALDRQAALIDLSPDGVIVCDIGGTVQFWSKGAEKLYGWNKEEAVNQNVHLLLHTRFPDTLKTIVEQLQAGRDWTGELTQQTKHGQTIIVQSFWHGELIDNHFDILESSIDITTRKRMEGTLRKSEKSYRSLFESMDEGFCMFEMLLDEGGRQNDGRFLEANPAFERHSGLRQVVGKTLRELIPEVENDWFDVYWKLAATGEPIRFVKYSKVLRRWFEVNAFRIGEPEECRVAALFRDITDRKQAEEELAAAKESAERAKVEAERANQTKDHFLAVLSHELRTPLLPIVMGTSMLLRRPDLDASARESLDIILRNAKMEGQLIDDLLDVTRIEHGKLKLDQRPVQLSTVIRRAVEVCQPDIEARRLHFGVDMGKGGDYWIKTDVARLQQVFWNLLKNAIKFTPHDGCVGIRCRQDGNHVLVEVNDSGIGIEQESLSSIFNAFEQAGQTGSRQFGGLGLGLAISKAIVELNEGTIHAFSKGRGQGATFCVKLPLINAPTTQRRISPKTETPPHATNPLRILLVEDHGVSARLITQLLKAEGNRVEVAGAVADALEAADRQPFDLLLCDLGLPDGTGYELMEQLRLRGYHFPGIALSGYGQEMDIQQSYKSGFAAHLTKPASRERLLAAIESVTSPKRIRILLVDDHEIYRRGLARMLKAEPDVEVIGEAADGESAVNLARDIRPDVVLMDVCMPGMDGVEATRIIHHELPETRVIALSMREEAEDADAMREAGAISYLTKSEQSPHTMLSAIRAED